jgi:hypothetical protein
MDETMTGYFKLETESSDTMMSNEQHDWFTPEGRAAAWREIEKNAPSVLEAYEKEKGQYVERSRTD